MAGTENKTDDTQSVTVSAKEAAQRFGFYTDEALLHPVYIQRHGVTRLVMISAEEYERLNG